MLVPEHRQQISLTIAVCLRSGWRKANPDSGHLLPMLPRHVDVVSPSSCSAGGRNFTACCTQTWPRRCGTEPEAESLLPLHAWWEPREHHLWENTGKGSACRRSCQGFRRAEDGLWLQLQRRWKHLLLWGRFGSRRMEMERRTVGKAA